MILRSALSCGLLRRKPYTVATTPPKANDASRIATKFAALGDRVSVMVSVDGTTPDGDVTLRTAVNEVVSESWTVKVTGTVVTAVGVKGTGTGPRGVIVGAWAA